MPTWRLNFNSVKKLNHNTLHWTSKTTDQSVCYQIYKLFMRIITNCQEKKYEMYKSKEQEGFRKEHLGRISFSLTTPIYDKTAYREKNRIQDTTLNSIYRFQKSILYSGDMGSNYCIGKRPNLSRIYWSNKANLQ